MTTQALQGVAPEWFTPVSQELDDDPTEYQIKGLTSPQIESVMIIEDGTFNIPVKNYHLVLKMGLIDWKNFNGENEKPLKHSSINHKCISFTDRIDIATQILNISNLGEEQEKN